MTRIKVYRRAKAGPKNTVTAFIWFVGVHLSYLISIRMFSFVYFDLQIQIGSISVLYTVGLTDRDDYFRVSFDYLCSEPYFLRQLVHYQTLSLASNQTTINKVNQVKLFQIRETNNFYTLAY